MSTTEIISLIASICAAVSAIAAVISCIVHYRFMKPKIKVIIHQKPQDCYYVYTELVNEGRVRVGRMPVSIYNSSAVGGTIGGIELIYKKSRYSVETINSNYQPWFKINPGTLKQDPEAFRLKVPLIVPAYSAIVGYFLFPDFPIVNDEKLIVTIKLRIIEGHLKVRKIKNVRFEEHNRNISSFRYNFAPQVTNSETSMDSTESKATYSFVTYKTDENK